MNALSDIQFFEIKKYRGTNKYKKVALTNIFTRKYIAKKMLEKKAKMIKERALLINKKLELAPDSSTVFQKRVEKIKSRADRVNQLLKTA